MKHKLPIFLECILADAKIKRFISTENISQEALKTHNLKFIHKSGSYFHDVACWRVYKCKKCGMLVKVKVGVKNFKRDFHILLRDSMGSGSCNEFIMQKALK